MEKLKKYIIFYFSIVLIHHVIALFQFRYTMHVVLLNAYILIVVVLILFASGRKFQSFGRSLFPSFLHHSPRKPSFKITKIPFSCCVDIVYYNRIVINYQ